jgi:hypothetical protein
MRESEHGAKLYNAWRKIRRSPHCEEWSCYPPFYNWAMQNGYVMGAWLRLINETGEYSPDNCKWHIPGSKDDDPILPETWADEWNKTVNRIRKHYGMPPLGGDDHGW